MKPSLIHASGTLLAGKFRVVRLLGAGGMGAVYEVENEQLAKRCALKVLHTDEHSSPDMVQRFRREVKAAGLIGNAHIVEVHWTGELDSGEPYVVMELLEGETLANLIERKGQLELEEICELVGQACDGVQAAHDAGIVHRDLKPANLFVTTRDGKPFVKLLDFGISKFNVDGLEDMTQTREGAILGTPYYMAPEQILGKTDIDTRVDVYALGVIMYECASGRVPYRADAIPALSVHICEGKPEPLGKLRPGLPEEFRNRVVQAMAVDREDRPSSAKKLGETLRAIGARDVHALKSEMADDDPMRRTDLIEEPVGLPRPAPVLALGSRRWMGVAVAAVVVNSVVVLAMLVGSNKDNGVSNAVGSATGSSTVVPLQSSSTILDASTDPPSDSPSDAGHRDGDSSERDAGKRSAEQPRWKRVGISP